jgi:two-component system, NtrC family, response regulator HydG
VPQNILLVDDDENILFLFGLALEENGFRVETATTGTEALSLMGAIDFDIALLDYRLSDQDGLSLAKEIQNINDKTSIIVVTGNSEIMFSQDMDQTISKVLLKPVTEETLVSEIHMVLDQENSVAEAS